MQPDKWKIYAARLKNQSISYSSPSSTLPIVVNAHSLIAKERNALKKEGCLFDDEGKNISSLNPYFCELTSIYWAINNSEEEYLGSAHYRRKWSDDGIVHSEPGVLYVSDPSFFNCSMAQQFLDGHAGFDAPGITIGLAERGLIPFSPSQLKAVWEHNVLHGSQMARGPKECYRRFMNLAFDCLWPFWEENKEEIMATEGYNRRMVGFVGERMMTALILCRDSFFDFPIATSRIEFKP